MKTKVTTFAVVVFAVVLIAVNMANAQVTVTDRTFYTDQGMFAANEFILSSGVSHASPGFAGAVWKDNYWYSRYYLGYVMARSANGIHVMWGPINQAHAVAPGAPPDMNGNGTNVEETLMATIGHFEELTGGTAPMNAWPQFVEFFSADPHYTQPVDMADANGDGMPDFTTDFATIHWDRSLADRRVVPAALGQTLLKQVLWSEYFLGGSRGTLLGISPQEGFAGLVLMGESANKMKNLVANLAYDPTTQSLGMVDPMTYDPAAGLKYFPHAVAVSETPTYAMIAPVPSYDSVLDATSDLFDQASLLWAAMEFYWISNPDNPNTTYNDVFDGDPFPAAGTPGPFDLSMGLGMIVHKNLKAMHFDDVKGTFVDTHDGTSRGDHISTFKAGYTIVALKRCWDNDIMGMRPDTESLINAQANFIVNHLTDPDGGFYNGYTLATGPDNSPKSLQTQAGAIRGLLAAYQVTQNVAFKDAATAGYTYVKGNFWNAAMKTFLTEEGTTTATYTPNVVAAVSGMLRELSLVAGDASADQTYVDFFNTVVNGGMQQSEFMPTGEMGGDSDGDGVPFVTDGDGPFGIAPVIAGEATLDMSTPTQSTDSTLVASKDNTIYSEADSSNGAGEHLFAGNTSRGNTRRGLIAFDVAATISAGAVVESVTLTLNMSRTSSGAQEVALHRLLADWGEGTSDAAGQEGGGATATIGDATWRHRLFDTDLWANEGGDFSTTPSATQTVDALGSYTWGPTNQMVADVQLWVDKPDSNFGWVLLGNESVPRTSKRFDSKDISDESVRPMLRITFSPTTSVASQDESVPNGFELAQNYPNPFNPSTAINYTIPQSANLTDVKIEIFNLLGQKVRTLVDARQQPGSHSIRWNGTDDAGESLASGVFVYRLQAGRFVDAKKMVFVR